MDRIRPIRSALLVQLPRRLALAFALVGRAQPRRRKTWEQNNPGRPTARALASRIRGTMLMLPSTAR